MSAPNAALPWPKYWYKGDDLADSDDQVKVGGWDDASGNTTPLVQTNEALQPILLNPGGEPPAVRFTGAAALHNDLTQHVGVAHSIYLVGHLDSTFGAKTFGPAVRGGHPGGNEGILAVSASVMQYWTPGGLTQLSYSLPAGGGYLWTIRRQPLEVELTCHGHAADVFPISNAADIPFSGLSAALLGAANLRQCAILEVLMYDWRLDDDSHAAVLGYLTGKYPV